MAKPNMNPAKTPMPVLDPALRARTFDEVAVGYSDSDAQNEAARCLGCKNPACVGGCPVGINIPAFIAKIKENDTEGAYRVISIDSSLPAVCGRKEVARMQKKAFQLFMCAVIVLYIFCIKAR